MPEFLREEALDCAERLRPLQTTSAEAVTFYLQHRQKRLEKLHGLGIGQEGARGEGIGK